MKRLIFTALCAIALLCSCNEEGKIKTINVKVTVNESKLGDVKPESYTVILTNKATAVETKATTENGIATAAVVPGVYNVTATAAIAEDGFTYSITGSVSEVSFIAENDETEVTVSLVKESQLIFKELYYNCCTYETGEVDENGKPSTDTYIRDQYYEIYNNSNEVAYADGLCITQLLYANYDYTTIYEFEVPGADAADYVFIQDAWQIGGNGTTYPIEPGESIIIAQWATNHKAENLTNGGSPVDLSIADFEAIEKEETLFNGTVITDGPAHNMKFAVNTKGWKMPQWLTNVGGSYMVIFKPESPLRQDNFLLAKNDDYTQVLEIPISEVYDAVQAIEKEADVALIRTNALLDAGYIWLTDTYTGKSISRKVAETTLANGSAKYVDTNNTVNDFEINDSPVIRRNGAKVPSWNTWNK
mgnify:CR=1 FL=1